MKRFFSIIIRYPFSLIIPGIALFCLDIKPLGALLMIVGSIIYIAKHFGNRGNKGGSSISTTEAAYLVYGDS